MGREARIKRERRERRVRRGISSRTSGMSRAARRRLARGESLGGLFDLTTGRTLAPSVVAIQTFVGTAGLVTSLVFSLPLELDGPFEAIRPFAYGGVFLFGALYWAGSKSRFGAKDRRTRLVHLVVGLWLALYPVLFG